MHIDDLIRILQASFAPMALVSGVGLILLSMTNRYARTMDRVRLLVAERRSAEPGQLPRIEEQIRILYLRSRLLRAAITLLAISIFCACLMVVTMFALATFGVPLHHLVLWLFGLGQVALAIAMLLFIRDLAISLEALGVEIRGR